MIGFDGFPWDSLVLRSDQKMGRTCGAQSESTCHNIQHMTIRGGQHSRTQLDCDLDLIKLSVSGGNRQMRTRCVQCYRSNEVLTYWYKRSCHGTRQMQRIRSSFFGACLIAMETWFILTVVDLQGVHPREGRSLNEVSLNTFKFLVVRFLLQQRREYYGALGDGNRVVKTRNHGNIYLVALDEGFFNKDVRCSWWGFFKKWCIFAMYWFFYKQKAAFLLVYGFSFPGILISSVSSLWFNVLFFTWCSSLAPLLHESKFLFMIILWNKFGFLGLWYGWFNVLFYIWCSSLALQLYESLLIFMIIFWNNIGLHGFWYGGFIIFEKEQTGDTFNGSVKPFGNIEEQVSTMVSSDHKKLGRLAYITRWNMIGT
ncbi:uncharacterized protein LOC103841044 isoform X1 [Brassica rapa]|uniref:uncharacterized protein LOC103841044 isoform X1 n=2 Tax=Brassica campestris TaxID=3711 RepID=UPI00142DB922|nr:uncharacterized protein LOC103841044 isoform X1 [Brassica rapa]